MGAKPKGSDTQSSATGTLFPGLLSANAGQLDLHNVKFVFCFLFSIERNAQCFEHQINNSKWKILERNFLLSSLPYLYNTKGSTGVF